jgi:hypothetical protein
MIFTRKKGMIMNSRKFCVSVFFGAISLGFVGLSQQAEQQPLATRVDHVFVISDNAQSLFTFFKDNFRLPEAWPFSERGTFASGGLSLGNADLELLKAEWEWPKDRKPLKTVFYGIALEPTLDADATAEELTRRNIPHTRTRTERSSMVHLTDFPPKNADIFFCDYKDRQAAVRRRKAISDRLISTGGGPLGIVGVAEITVGVQDLQDARGKWSVLLNSSPRISDDALNLSSGPRIHLVHSESPGIQGIVLRVLSIREAEKFLKERRLLAKDDTGHTAISPMAIEGLSIRLVEK